MTYYHMPCCISSKFIVFIFDIDDSLDALLFTQGRSYDPNGLEGYSDTIIRSVSFAVSVDSAPASLPRVAWCAFFLPFSC